MLSENKHTIADFFSARGFPLLSNLQIVNSFSPAVLIGDLAFVSSATPLRQDGSEITGKIGDQIDISEAKEAACLCLAHSLSLLQLAVGEPLDGRLVRAVDLTFFMNAASDFGKQSEIADTASNLLLDILGPNGAHSRSALGAGSLVRGVSVVLKGLYQLRTPKI
ncbi:MAG: endoribonuclease L-PSP [Acidobacteria bacterium OLB17]|nr:MAG: endoribonuclease L-PSP [Acidobacteria bacterium OLB17]MCZ2390326.1 RidA family protein [Acidobacteriota bacterium]